jgi:phage antirepressor YoqD-like protein
MDLELRRQQLLIPWKWQWKQRVIDSMQVEMTKVETQGNYNSESAENNTTTTTTTTKKG